MTQVSGPVTVLHVDDDPELGDLVATFLERESERLSVETESRVSHALDRLDGGDIDCVVSDYDMPDRTGIEFLEAVRERRPDLPFILFTGKGSEEVASEAISAGVTDYLQKGFDSSQYVVLANRITNAVEQYRSQRELEAGQKRLSLFVDQTPLGVIEYNQDFEIVQVNEAGEEILGYTEAELKGETWERLVAEESFENVDAVTDALAMGEGGFHSIDENIRGDGERIVCEWHNRVITDETGEVVATFSLFQDITDRREREQAVENLHQVTQQLMQVDTVDAIAEIIVDSFAEILDMPVNSAHFYDEDGHCLEPAAWTAQAEELLGDIPTFEPDAALAWEAFETGEPHVYDDVSNAPGRLNAETNIRSELILPLEDHGVVVVGAADAGVFDGTDVSLAKTLAAHATTALDRIEREQALREERAFIDQALDTLDDIFYVVGTDGTVLRWNAHAQATTGYTEAEIKRMDAIEIFPEDERPKARDGIQKTLRDGQATLQADVLTADGERVPHEFISGRLTDATGETIGIVGIGRNIATHERQKDQIEQLQHRTQTLMNTYSREETARVAVETARDVLGAPLSGFHLLDDEQAVLEPIAFVDTLREEFGEPPRYDRRDGDPIADLVWDVFTEGDPFVVDDLSEYGSELAELTPARNAILHPLDDYGVFILSSTEPNFFDETDKALIEMLATSLKTALERVERETRLRERERQLQVERDRFGALFETISEPISYVRFEEDEPILLDVNPAFESTFGYDIDEVRGQSANDLIIPPEKMDEAQRVDEQVRRDGAIKQEVQRQTTDGIGDFLFRSVPVGDAEVTDEYFGIHVDITELKAYERRLERQNERLDEFANIVSHDLRNPLSVAQGHLELARDSDDADHLDAVEQAHQRMETLVDDVLLLARHGETATETEHIDLGETVRSCWATVQTSSAHLEVETEQVIDADESRLKQLLENLVRNSIEHAGPEVTVTVGDLTDGFYIADDGPGIAEADPERIFEAGYSSLPDGTGFGLRIVTQIADAHDWSVTVTESQTGGARFEIAGVLPATE